MGGMINFEGDFTDALSGLALHSEVLVVACP